MERVCFERSVILREELDEGGRAMVMRDDERVRPTDQVMEISRLSSSENLVCVTENLIFDAFLDF